MSSAGALQATVDSQHITHKSARARHPHPHSPASCRHWPAWSRSLFPPAASPGCSRAGRGCVRATPLCAASPDPRRQACLRPQGYGSTCCCMSVCTGHDGKLLTTEGYRSNRFIHIFLLVAHKVA